MLSYIGVRLAISAMLTFAAISFTAMSILAVAIIVQGGEPRHAAHVQPRHHVGGRGVSAG